MPLTSAAIFIGTNIPTIVFDECFPSLVKEKLVSDAFMMGLLLLFLRGVWEEIAWDRQSR